MAVRIGHASIDENGNIAGGKIGDQTGKEICIRPWYDKDWNVYLECTDLDLADRAADIMEQICNDPNFGYDQNQRLTAYESIKANGGKVKGAKGESDCSSTIALCYKLAGLDISPALTTRNMRNELVKTGKFRTHFDSAHTDSDKYARRGNIYLREGSHVVMALSNGSYMVNIHEYPSRILVKGASGDDVKWVQFELRQAGILTVVIDGETYKLTVDGEFGKITDAAVRLYQKMNKLTVDGEVGPKTRDSLRVR